MTVLKGNAGEWSELYAMFQLLIQGELTQEYSHLNEDRSDLKVLAVKRSLDDGDVLLKRVKGGIEVSNKNGRQIVAKETLENAAASILDSLNTDGKEARAFPIPGVEDFIRALGFNSVKAKSSQKSDLFVQLEDLKSESNPWLGFSVKSAISQPATLLNPSGLTRFEFRIGRYAGEFSKEELKRLAECESVSDRITGIRTLGGRFEFIGITGATFSNNLRTIDSRMPELVAELVLDKFVSKESDLKILSRRLSERNPFGFSRVDLHNYYEYKIKKLLSESALGMIAKSPWSGKHSATGGFLVVNSDGSISGYHFFNQNEFENYLLENTMLDLPSTGKRHPYGSISVVDGELTILLILQIRFKKIKKPAAK